MNFQHTWHRFLSTKRLGSDTVGEATEERSAFQRDFDRIAFSSAFRRLQDKTQVFPLAESDYVRTRLTHSIEVSCVGRSLGSSVGAGIIQRHNLSDLQPSDFGAVVAAAAVAHDIGNPPFGHSGEDAMRYWFEDSSIAENALSDLDDRQRKDFLAFEGNAQGFRVLTRLQNPHNSGGLQLTSAVLGAFTKYPRPSHPDVEPSALEGVSSKKHGFFLADKESFQEVATTTGLEAKGPDGHWQRHPLAFLVEAADDICYRVIDFEDGFRLGHVHFHTARDLLTELIRGGPDPRTLARITGQKEKIEYLRAKAISSLIESAARTFLENEETILSGEFDKELVSVGDRADALNEIKRVSISDVYTARPVLEIEAAGFEVLGGMLDLFVDAVTEVAQRGRPHSKSRKLLQLMPDQFLGPDRKPDADPYLRLIKVTDFVSGMTDGFAVSTFKKIKGISLPHA